METQAAGGLARPRVTSEDAVRIAAERYGVCAAARELGSNQDRNFLLTEEDGGRSVLRIDNPAWEPEARRAQLAAIDVLAGAGIPAPAVLYGLDGEPVQHWRGYAGSPAAIG